MGFTITAGAAEPLRSGVWQLDMPPHQIRLFGDCRRAEGERSVLLVSAARFDPDAKTLTFDAEAVTPLNIGRSHLAVVIGQDDSTVTNVEVTPLSNLRTIDTSVDIPPASVQPLYSYGPGDREFLSVASEIDGPGREAAEKLLAEVRKRSPGDLKRGKQRNFSNTPDNFWYVIVQSRLGGLSITVRGEPNRFGSQRLVLKQDRPGYTRFKVASSNDVTDAIRIIFASKMRT